MTPTDPGSAGELSVAITGDVSALLEALDEAQSGAEKAGEEIASALSSATSQMSFDFGDKLNEQFSQIDEGAKSSADSFDELRKSVAESFPPMFQFSEAAQDVISKQKELEEEWLSSTHALIEIQNAFQNGSASMLDVARAQEEVAHAFEKANPLAHESAEGFGELVGVLGEFAGKIGIAVGLEEIGREALSAYSHIQDLTTAFTFLSGSAEKAAEQVEQIKDIGIKLAVPMEQLETAAQRMTVSFGSFEKTLPVLKDAADVSAITGRNFDAVAGAIERMSLSGNAGSRQLVALGITTAQLGEAMDVTAAEATKAFKALDIGDRLEVLHTAMAKTGGAAEAMALNLRGTFTTFRNELDDSMEEIGKVLAPVAGAILTSFSDILSATRPLLAAFAELANTTATEALNNLSEAAHEFGEAIKLIDISSLTGGLSDLSAEIGRLTGMPLSDFFKQAASDTFNYLTHVRDLTDVLHAASAGIEALTGKSTAMAEASAKILETLRPLPPKLTETGESAAEFSKGLQAIIDKQEGANAAVAKAKGVLAEARDALNAGQISQKEYQRALVEYENALNSLTPKVHAAASAHTAHADAMDKARQKAEALLSPVSLLTPQLKLLNDITQILADNTINVNGKMTFAAETVIPDYTVSMEKAGAKIVEFSDATEQTGDNIRNFEGAAKIAVQRLTDIQSAAKGAKDAMVDLGGGLQTAASALEEVNAKALANLDTWGKIAAAAGQAGAAMKSAGASGASGMSSMAAEAGVGSDMGSGAGSFGPIKGTVSGLQMIAAAGAFPFGVASNILPSETALAMMAQGFQVIGNNMFATAEEMRGFTHALGDAKGEFIDLAGRVHGANVAAAEAVETWTTFTKSMDENGKIITHATTHTAQDLNNIPWTTLKQNVDQAGNAIESFSGIGTSVYNVNAHLEDLVQGVTNAEVAFGGAVTFGAQIAQATAVVGAAAQIAAHAAGIALSALPRPTGAMQMPTPFLPNMPTFSAPPSGVANSNTLGTNPGGIQILVTGNAITSQDSAQRLTNTMVAGLRNSVGLKL